MTKMEKIKVLAGMAVMAFLLVILFFMNSYTVLETVCIESKQGYARFETLNNHVYTMTVDDVKPYHHYKLLIKKNGSGYKDDEIIKIL